MYLFVSCVCPKLAGLKKAGFFAALLLSSLVAHATPSTVEKTAAVVTPQSDQMTDAGKQHFNFPRWPQRQKAVREIIPPPPPGPYMSSALSDYSVRAPSFGRDMNKDVKPNPARMRDSAPVSMDDFSPDIPWPKNLRQGHENHEHQSPHRWMPENGYRYIAPQAAQQSLSMPSEAPRWMPSMGISRQAPYRQRPNYGANSNPRYGQQSSHLRNPNHGQ